MYLTDVTEIYRMEEVESKDAPAQSSSDNDCYNANWWACFDEENNWCKCSTGYYMTGLYRTSDNNLQVNLSHDGTIKMIPSMLNQHIVIYLVT